MNSISEAVTTCMLQLAAPWGDGAWAGGSLGLPEGVCLLLGAASPLLPQQAR